MSLTTEWDIIQKLKNKKIVSPARYGPLWLFSVRVTGTGFAYRPQLKEWTYRNPAYYLTRSFLDRITGLPVLMEHSENSVIKGGEFHDKNIGILVCPWIENKEVWGIAKVYDDADAVLIVDRFNSTSPSVSFGDDGKYINLSNGGTLFVEGRPVYVDHLAMVQEGVWDKYKGASGVSLNIRGVV